MMKPRGQKRWWYFYHKDSEGKEYYYGKAQVKVPTKTKLYIELLSLFNGGNVKEIRYCTDSFTAFKN